MMMAKRILTIQDLPCVGQCSLTIALPVLSAYGIETCVLPTSILSNHTAFPQWSCLDFTSEMWNIMKSWRKNDFKFDAFLLGYLGSIAAMDAAKTCFRDFSNKAVNIIIDPVLGDYGRLYPAFNHAYVTAMTDLIRSAHIILPNFTEVCFLTGMEYLDHAPVEYIKECIAGLARLTPSTIVMTGAESEGRIGELIYSGGAFTEVWTEMLPGRFHGTGDLFAASFTAVYLQNGNLAEACEVANRLVTASMSATEADAHWYGVSFESALSELLE